MSQLYSNQNGDDGNDGSVDKKGDDTRTFGKVGLDKDVDILLDSFVPGQGGDQAKRGGDEGDNLSSDGLSEEFDRFLFVFHKSIILK